MVANNIFKELNIDLNLNIHFQRDLYTKYIIIDLEDFAVLSALFL